MTERKCLVFSFADIEVREREFSIVRNGEVLAVEPKAFRVLLFLLRNSHKLITKDELLDAVWNDTAVSENSLTRSIAMLRRLLGDDIHEPRYIATVPTVGYRFLCDVTVADDGIVISSSPDSASSPKGAPETTGDSNEARQPVVAEAVAADSHIERGGRRTVRRLLVPGLLTALLVILAAAFFAMRVAGKRDGALHLAGDAKPGANMRVVPLTSLPDAVADPAISPNGDTIAFTWFGENPAKGDIYVQLVGGEKPLRLTHTKTGYVCCANWSPDGREIAFGRCDDNGGSVSVIPALGGPERKLTDVLCLFCTAGEPKWIDSKSLLLTDRCTPGGPKGLVTFSMETGEKRCLTAPPPHSDQGDFSAVLSPEHKRVAFLRSTTVDMPQLYTISLAGGEPHQLTSGSLPVWAPMWSPDGHYIIFGSNRNGLPQLFRVPAEGGAIEPDTTYSITGASSQDGRRLVYVDAGGFVQPGMSIWRIDLSGPGGAVVSKEKVLASDGGNFAPQPSPDGRQLVFQSGRSGRSQIWRTDADGSNPLQMTSFDTGFVGTPRWSPDGKWIAFDRHTETHSQIYLVDSEGRNTRMAVSGDYENVVPSWSRDGTVVYFASNRSGNWQLWRHELAITRETQITRNGGFAAFESEDGKTLYYSKFEGGGLWKIPAGGGKEEQITDALHVGYWGHFAVTDAGIYLLDANADPDPAILFYSFQSHRFTSVLSVDHPQPWTANLAASRDGRTLFFAQKLSHSSIMMAENLQ